MGNTPSGEPGAGGGSGGPPPPSSTPKEHVAVEIEDEEEVKDVKLATSKESDKKNTSKTPGHTHHDSHHDDYDNDFLHRVVEDAGRWAYGIVFVEVWVLNMDKTHLYRPNDGWWIDQYYHDRIHSEIIGESSSSSNGNGNGNGGGGNNTKTKSCCPFCKLTDTKHEEYLDAVPLPPGVGLPGVLWSEVQRGNYATTSSRRLPVPTSPSSQSSAIGSGSPGSPSSSSGRDHQHDTTFGDLSMSKQQQVTWRQIKPLANDPDQPWNPRLQFLANECELEWAAGVPFSVGDVQGLVVYMARHNAQFTKLSNACNESYLINATLLIGTAMNLRHYRHEQLQRRRVELDTTLIRVRNKLLAMKHLGIPLENLINAPPKVSIETQQQLNEMMKKNQEDDLEAMIELTTTLTKSPPTWIECLIRKCIIGGNVLPPPSFTWEQTMWTLFSAFVSLLVLTRIHVRLVGEYGPTSGIVLGPFGALMTLQYGLTAAPASQPRNAIVGQAVSLVIAQVIGTKADFMEVWLKQSVATSLSIAFMAKLGAIHPPAGAAALLFSVGLFTWRQVAVMLMGNCVAILLATVFNNLNSKRQYPTFWGIGYIKDLLTCNNGKTPEESKKNN